jgi:hypothetical protein
MPIQSAAQKVLSIKREMRNKATDSGFDGLYIIPVPIMFTTRSTDIHSLDIKYIKRFIEVYNGI